MWLKKKREGAPAKTSSGCRLLCSLLWKLALAVLLVYGAIHVFVRTSFFRSKVEAELSRLAVALGGRAETAAGLSGLGDLVLTCAGTGSRNMSLGMALGRGETMAEVLAARAGVTEGVATAPAIVARAAAAGVEMPICAAVAELVAGRITVPDAMARLLARPQRAE